jgi:hypothetical protein
VGSRGLIQGPGVGSCENDTEHSGAIKGGEFLEDFPLWISVTPRVRNY